MNRDPKKLALALLMDFVLVVTIGGVSVSMLRAQSPQTDSADKPQASVTPAAAPSSAKATSTPSASPSTPPAATAPASSAKHHILPANAAGLVWINTDTSVYHKRGSRWYGKTRHGKYMLEADAIKAGYKPAK
jgi:predicted lipid-binding transport protein (Tim44 family)